MVHIDGEVLEGEYFGPLIDFPLYSYDSAQGILTGAIFFPLADSLIGIFGDGIWLTGAAGGGAASGLGGIYNLPWGTFPEFISVNPDESVNLKYGDALLALAKGQVWERITTRLDTSSTGIARLTTTDRICNYGFQLKSRIHRWNG